MDEVATPRFRAGETPSRQDVLWLDRVTYGPTTATVDRYLKLGRRRFLDEQLHPHVVQLPSAVAAEIDALEISHSDGAQLLAYVAGEQQRINALGDDAMKLQGRKALNEKGNKVAYEAARRELLRAISCRARAGSRKRGAGA